MNNTISPLRGGRKTYQATPELYVRAGCDRGGVACVCAVWAVVIKNPASGFNVLRGFKLVAPPPSLVLLSLWLSLFLPSFRELVIHPRCESGRVGIWQTAVPVTLCQLAVSFLHPIPPTLRVSLFPLCFCCCLQSSRLCSRSLWWFKEEPPSLRR